MSKASSDLTFAEPNEVTFTETRWNLLINVEDYNGDKHQFVASADAALTQQDGIWFGSKADYEAALARGGF